MSSVWHVKAGLSPIVSLASLKETLLAQRGIEVSGQSAFFMPKYERDIHDTASLFGMSAAVELIFDAIKQERRILVYGDYDVDGITSTAIMMTVLRDLGAHASPYIPHRTDDGYGLSLNVLKRLKSEFDLLITVDCGITAREEAAWLKQQGKEVIITDHHTVPGQLPEAAAIIHPRHPQGNYAWPSLCGAGVAWKVAAALARSPRGSLRADPDYEKWLLDLVMLGTLADCVPLVGENRAIVKFGFEILRRTKRVGLATLLDSLRLDRGALSVQDIVFKIIPRLNAAGRMEHAQPALDLLLTQSEPRAIALLSAINSLNQQRQTITKRILIEAEAQVAASAGELIFAYNHDWPTGVTGLVANRLVEKFSRPAIVVGGAGAVATGSARAPSSVNVLEILRRSEHLLLKLGGHLQAAGFTVSVEQLGSFRQSVCESAGALKNIGPAKAQADVVADAMLLKRQTARVLHDFEPFGEGNEQPQLVMKNLKVVETRTVGKSNEHAKLTFWIDEEPVDGIGFGLAGLVPAGRGSFNLDVLGELEENEWRGRSRLQINIKDMALAGGNEILAE